MLLSSYMSTFVSHGQDNGICPCPWKSQSLYLVACLKNDEYVW